MIPEAAGSLRSLAATMLKRSQQNTIRYADHNVLSRMTLSRAALVAFAVLWHSTAAAQLRVSAPPGKSLLDYSINVAHEGRLPELRTATIRNTDLEFRFWAGFGLNGTYGLILRRTNDKWTVEEVEEQSCRIAVEESRRNPLNASQIAEYERAALTPCSAQPRGRGNRILTAIRIQRKNLDTLPNGPRIWSDLLGAGVLTFPPKIPREAVMLDGHSFVVEFRDAAEYRVSDIACTTRPPTIFDRQAQRVGRILYDHVRQVWWLRCDTRPLR